ASRCEAQSSLSMTGLSCPKPICETRSERVNPGNASSDNQRVNIVRALVGLYAFEVHQVPHDRIIVGHSVCSQNISRRPRALECHPDVVSLGHRDMLMLYFSCIFQASHL